MRANEYIRDLIEIAKNLLAACPQLRSFREKVSTKRERLLNDIEIPSQVVKNLIDRTKIDLKDKIVLEIGPGYSLAMGLFFLALGPKKVILLDRFKYIFWDENGIS